MMDLAELEQRVGAGVASAPCGLGVRYYKGDGVPRVFARAREWFLKAAGQDSALQ